MEDLFVPYELALELKELGFNEPCLGYFLCKNSSFGVDDLLISTEIIDLLPYDSSSCKTPIFSQSFKFFRERYNLECHIKSLYEQRENKGFYFGIDDYTNRDFYSKPYYSYEEAELECLKKLIEIIKK